MMRDFNRQTANARKDTSKNTAVLAKARKRDFAVVLKGKVIGLFERAADAETAMRNIIPPDPPGTLEIVQISTGRSRRAQTHGG
jgi:hypothetical protein